MNDEKANDATKIAPELHEVIFENGKLRVLKVTVKPGANAAMHWHPENINYVLAPGKLRFNKPDGAVVEVELANGQVTSSPAGSHAVENMGDTEVRTVQIELKGDTDVDAYKQKLIEVLGRPHSGEEFPAKMNDLTEEDEDII